MKNFFYCVFLGVSGKSYPPTFIGAPTISRRISPYNNSFGREKLVCLSLSAAIFLFILLGISPAGAQVRLRQILPKPIPTISLVYPKGGENLTTGTDYGIVWQYSGISDDAMVQIVLLKDGSKFGVIVQQTPIHYSSSPSGTGAFKWKAASILRGTVGPGCTYRIRVRVLEGVATWGDSARDFCIAGPAPQKNLVLQTPTGGAVHDQSAGAFENTPATQASQPKLMPQTFRGVAVDQWIKVTAPAAGAILEPINQYDINWERSESMKKKWAKFILLKGGQPFIVLTDKAYLNSGHNYFQLPGGGAVPPGDDYQIRIESLDDPGIKGDSGFVHVVAKVTPDYETYYIPTTANRIMEEDFTSNQHEVSWDTIPNAFKELASEGSFSLPPDPGPGAIHVGVVRGNPGWSLSFRSFVLFDFKGLKGNVKSAKLTYDETVYPSNYPIVLYPLIKLDSQWNGSTADLFGKSGMVLDNPESSFPQKLKDVVQGWIDNPATNFGMVMTAVGEGSVAGSDGEVDPDEHQSIMKNVKLVIVIDVID